MPHKRTPRQRCSWGRTRLPPRDVPLVPSAPHLQHPSRAGPRVVQGQQAPIHPPKPKASCALILAAGLQAGHPVLLLAGVGQSPAPATAAVGSARSPGTLSVLLEGEKPSHDPSGLLQGRQKPPPCPRVSSPLQSPPGGCAAPSTGTSGAWQTPRPPRDSQGRRQHPSPGEPAPSPSPAGPARRGVKRGHSGRIVRLGRTRSLWKQQLIPFHPPSRPSAVFQAFRRRVAETRAIVSASPQPPPSIHPSIPAPRWARIRQHVHTQLLPQHRPQPDLHRLPGDGDARPMQDPLLFASPQALSLTPWSKPRQRGRGGEAPSISPCRDPWAQAEPQRQPPAQPSAQLLLRQAPRRDE